MEEKKENQRIYSLADNFKKIIPKAKHKCLRCGAKTIGSHIIQRKILEILSKDGIIKSWPDPRKPKNYIHLFIQNIKTFIETNEFKISIFKEGPQDMGIKEDNITFDIFCEKCDSAIFEEIEKKQIDFNDKKQIVLLAYRYLCYNIYPYKTVKKVIDNLSHLYEKYKNFLPKFFNPIKVLDNLFQFDYLFQLKDIYETMMNTNDYSRLKEFYFKVDSFPKITYTVTLPLYDNDKIQKVSEGIDTFSPSEVISISFLPINDKENICIVSWIDDESLIDRISYGKDFSTMSNEEKEQIFIELGFKCAKCLYISPDWWKSLDSSKRDYYIDLHALDIDIE